MTEEIKDNEEVQAGVSEAEDAVETSEAPEELTVEQQLEAALVEASDYKDRWMRGQAEFANARKRMDKQRIQSYQNALADLAGKILPAIDDLDRAIENVPVAVSEDGWFEGIQLVQKKMISILENFNVKPIEAVGEPFDPNVHEAITMEPSDEYESEVVIREMQKGYMIGDQVIRPSLVVISQ
ncbi:MAG: nucleotide exchange factor GrpE [Chloroflexota bacterium]